MAEPTDKHDEAVRGFLSALASGRCYCCGWPLAAKVEDGCVPFNCSMRYKDGTEQLAEREQWRKRATAVAALHAWALGKPLPSAGGASEDVFACKLDCHYDGDISKCDKDCATLGFCKRRQHCAPSHEQRSEITDKERGELQALLYDAVQATHWQPEFKAVVLAGVDRVIEGCAKSATASSRWEDPRDTYGGRTGCDTPWTEAR